MEESYFSNKIAVATSKGMLLLLDLELSLIQRPRISFTKVIIFDCIVSFNYFLERNYIS